MATDPEIDILVELIGGTDTARELVLTAIKNGKHIVTANKALIAEHGNEIFQAAHQNGVDVAFEAAVAGGIPILKSLGEGLAANHINWVAGIINGTGNYILTEMEQGGRAFQEVLEEAQSLGYAEADPTFDVEGVDAAHKLTIIASIALPVDDIEVRLIRWEARPLVGRDIEAVRVRQRLSISRATAVDKRATGARRRHERDSHSRVPPRRGDIAKLLWV